MTTDSTPSKLPAEFQRSYNDFRKYPSNLVTKTTFAAASTSIRQRLDRHENDLLLEKDNAVLFRDFNGEGPTSGLSTTFIKDGDGFKTWLGCEETIDGQLVASKPDPRCRFIFITAESSCDALRISRTLYTRICTWHQVMPEYTDLLFIFGSQLEAKEARFGSFRSRKLLSKPSVGLPIPALGRSGRFYQLSYNLKSVECRSVMDAGRLHQDWAVHQAAVYHQFDVESGNALWLTTQPVATEKNQELRWRVIEMTSVDGQVEDRDFSSPLKSFRNSLTVHLLFCHWAVEEWRWYLQWLEETVAKKTDLAVYGSRGEATSHIFTPDDVQTIQYHEERLNSAIMVMEANMDVLSLLRDFYCDLQDSLDFDLRDVCGSKMSTFTSQMEALVYDAKMDIVRASILIKVVRDRKALVIQHLQSQATFKMETLTLLTIKIATMSQRETIAMRIITVVTLIYLPATFVSTFFSTDIVKYQLDGNSNGVIDSEQQNMGSFSKLALERWLQVTIPLTAVTLLAGWIAFKQAGKLADKEFEGVLVSGEKGSIRHGLPSSKKSAMLGRCLGYSEASL